MEVGTPLDALLEGFAAPAQGPEFHKQFTPGDHVRVKSQGAEPVHGRIVRFHQETGHAIIAPGSGQPHVRAELKHLSFDTPARHSAEAGKAKAQAMAHAAPGVAQAGKPAQGGPGSLVAGLPRQTAKLPQAGKPAKLREAFNPNKLETPAQSQTRGAQAVRQARSELASGAWNASKHPRSSGGRFGYTTGGKRARRAPTAKSRTLGAGSGGTLVRAVQRQLGLPPTGAYDAKMLARVKDYQRQHGLQVDGVIGRQTLAALRGHPNAKSVKPGPISSRHAPVLTPKHRRRKSGAPHRIGGGLVI